MEYSLIIYKTFCVSYQHICQSEECCVLHCNPCGWTGWMGLCLAEVPQYECGFRERHTAGSTWLQSWDLDFEQVLLS